MSIAKCPHCNEETEVDEPFYAFAGENGEIIEVEQTCTWCEKEFMTTWKAHITFEWQGTVG
jgi:predicted 3-demethylubiquinone-9 3-methyltransferase (glyoxalase superfamily)